MHTDPLLYRLFQERPATLFELAGLPTPSVACTLASVEVKQTAFRLDGVLSPVTSRPDLPVIFSENQFQRRRGFYDRWFGSERRWSRCCTYHRPT